MTAARRNPSAPSTVLPTSAQRQHQPTVDAPADNSATQQPRAVQFDQNQSSTKNTTSGTPASFARYITAASDFLSFKSNPDVSKQTPALAATVTQHFRENNMIVLDIPGGGVDNKCLMECITFSFAGYWSKGLHVVVLLLTAAAMTAFTAIAVHTWPNAAAVPVLSAALAAVSAYSYQTAVNTFFYSTVSVHAAKERLRSHTRSDAASEHDDAAVISATLGINITVYTVGDGDLPAVAAAYAPIGATRTVKLLCHRGHYLLILDLPRGSQLNKETFNAAGLPALLSLLGVASGTKISDPISDSLKDTLKQNLFTRIIAHANTLQSAATFEQGTRALNTSQMGPVHKPPPPPQPPYTPAATLPGTPPTQAPIVLDDTPSPPAPRVDTDANTPASTPATTAPTAVLFSEPETTERRAASPRRRRPVNRSTTVEPPQTRAPAARPTTRSRSRAAAAASANASGPSGNSNLNSN